MSKKGKSNLIALGSAAVLAVYTAGFARTRSAALLFANETERRRPTSDAPGAGERGAPSQGNDRPAATGSAAPVAPAATTVTPVTGGKDAKPTAKDARASGSTSSPTAQAGTAGTAATSGATTETKPVESAPVPAAPQSPAPVAPAAPAPADTAAPQENRGAYKDGLYYGWGTSRHGDIQASVEIRDGRIYAAKITQCLTRYSCSWIAHLQGQVAARQSPEVDYVSGATQSTNAFYYAVVEALKQAK